MTRDNWYVVYNEETDEVVAFGRGEDLKSYINDTGFYFQEV